MHASTVHTPKERRVCGAVRCGAVGALFVRVCGLGLGLGRELLEEKKKSTAPQEALSDAVQRADELRQDGRLGEEGF